MLFSSKEVSKGTEGMEGLEGKGVKQGGTEGKVSIPVIRDVAKKTDSTRYALPALRFKTCRLLSGNVWNRELTIIQRRILQRLRNKKRSIKRKIFSLSRIEE
ncbi:S4 RNA-binding domain-containing protein [Forsythia ovata]|uniref:S4 RNA-binding domain-containing protein n=1 Tax=Forsythia ovata TaxID=205694 RepID=A0ABD1NUQ9_9LAMI